MVILHCYWHLVVTNVNFTLLLTYNGQEWTISHCYWHPVVKNGNLTKLLTSSHQEWQFNTTSNVIRIIECHLVVKNANFTLLLTSSGYRIVNFTLLLTSSGQEWQFPIATDIQWSTMAVSLCYWQLVIKNGNLILLVMSLE